MLRTPRTAPHRPPARRPRPPAHTYSRRTPDEAESRHCADCPGGTNLAIAVPANPDDPLQTNWSKEAYTTNPIANNTGRDPSTAWTSNDRFMSQLGGYPIRHVISVFPNGSQT